MIWNCFLTVLHSCENQIGHQKSYGEIKAYVLAQTIKFLYHTEAYIFVPMTLGRGKVLPMVRRYLASVF